MPAFWQKYSIYLIPPFFGGGMCILLDFNGLYGQDAHEYYRYTQAFYQSLLHGEQPQDFFWGIGYPLLGALFSFITKNVLFSLQAISLICYTVIGILIGKCADLIFPNNAGSVTPFLPFSRKIALFLLYFSAPYCLRMGVLVMSDMLAALGVMLCFYAMTVFYYKNKNSSLYFAVAGASLAILTRYPPAVVVLPMLIGLIYLVFLRKKYLASVLSMLIVAVGVGLHVWIKGENLFAFTHHGSLYGWTLLNSFRRVLHTPDGIQYCTFPNILYAFGQFWHPAYLSVGIVLVFFIRKKDFTSFPIKIAVLSILLCAVFLMGIPFQNMRFLLLSFPLVSLLLFPALENFTQMCADFSRFRRCRWRFICEICHYLRNLREPQLPIFTLLIFLILGQMAMGFKLIHDLRTRNQWEKQVAADLQVYKGLTLYTFDIDVALGSYPVPLKIVNTWTEKVEDFEIGGLYFCEEKTLESQWVERNPLLNWQKVKAEYVLICVKTYKNGWKLYKIQKKL